MTYLERLQKLADELSNLGLNQKPQSGACPSCGRCPTCGRGAFWGTQPYPGYLPPPVWYEAPIYMTGPTCGVSGTATNNLSQN